MCKQINMNLLIWSIIVSFGNMFLTTFALKIIIWFMDSNKEDRKIIAEISFLKEEQSEISMVKEFAKHAKLQRKIIKLNEQLKTNIRANTTKNLKTKFTCRVFLYMSSVIINLLFVYYNYRQNVLNELPSNWFSPLSWLVSWPSSQDGTMSFLFWYSVTNCVAKVASNNLF